MTYLLQLACFGLLAVLGIGWDSVAAQKSAYPTRPIRFIVPFPPSGGTDILARYIADKLTEGLGQQVVVDNRVGAGGILGEELAAKSAPDGHVIVLVAISHAVNPGLYKKLPYDTVKDFAPVGLLVSVPNILVVNPGVPVKSVPELIALAKAKPGALNYGSAGNGSSPHLAGELFKAMAGLEIVRVSYRGGALALTDLLGARIQLMFAVIPTGLPLAKTGRLRALAVTSAKRSAAAPDLPTISEFVPGYEFIGWQGVLAPAGTPKSIVATLNREMVKILHMPDARNRFSSEGFEVIGGTPEDFSAFLKSELVKWSKLLRDAGIRAE